MGISKVKKEGIQRHPKEICYLNPAIGGTFGLRHHPPRGIGGQEGFFAI
jgi:hypothetical protein